MALTRDERMRRVAEIEQWIRDQNAEFADDAFPPEVRESWVRNSAELEEHKRVLAELASRDERLKAIGTEGRSAEEGLAFPEARGGPMIISRMNENEVFDVSNLRVSAFNPGGAHRELADRAKRAVELQRSFPRADNRTPGVSLKSREAAQAHVEELINRDDQETSYISKRILTTGNPDYVSAFAKTVYSALRGQSHVIYTEREERAIEAVRAMAALTGSAGGFAVPYFLDPTVVPTSNLSVNPYRAICRVETIPGNEWRGVTSAGVTAAYGAEASESSDNSPTLAQPAIIVQRASCFVPVSIELTQDWAGLQSELANLIQDSKDDLEAVQFTTGAGTTVFPQGLITGATSTLNTGGAGTFAIADLYSLEQAVPPRFRPRAQLIGNRFYWNKIRQFDTAGGAGLWVFLPAGLDNDIPRGGNLGVQVLGYGANEASAMSSTLATGQSALVMGDPRYYVIVDRVGMDIEVIPHLFGAANRFPTGQRGFFAFWRNKAAVLDPNAFRVLKIQ